MWEVTLGPFEDRRPVGVVAREVTVGVDVPLAVGTPRNGLSPCMATYSGSVRFFAAMFCIESGAKFLDTRIVLVAADCEAKLPLEGLGPPPIGSRHADVAAPIG
jgi:hypothetical protein